MLFSKSWNRHFVYKNGSEGLVQSLETFSGYHPGLWFKAPIPLGLWFRLRLYEQREGAPIGSPLSPVLANLYLEQFEKQAIDTCPPLIRPRYWRRYVDDMFTIIKKDTTKAVLQYLNSQHPSIQFTTSVYRKPTTTNRYLHYKSSHLLSTKAGII